MILYQEIYIKRFHYITISLYQEISVQLCLFLGEVVDKNTRTERIRKLCRQGMLSAAPYIAIASNLHHHKATETQPNFETPTPFYHSRWRGGVFSGKNLNELPQDMRLAVA